MVTYSVGHRSSLLDYHDQLLQLDKSGNYEFSNINKEKSQLEFQVENNDHNKREIRSRDSKSIKSFDWNNQFLNQDDNKILDKSELEIELHNGKQKALQVRKFSRQNSNFL